MCAKSGKCLHPECKSSARKLKYPLNIRGNGAQLLKYPLNFEHRYYIFMSLGLNTPCRPVDFMGLGPSTNRNAPPIPPPPSQRWVCIGRMQCAYNTQGTFCVNATSQHYGRKTTVTDFQFNTAVYRFKLSLCGVDLLIRRQFSGHCREPFLRCFPHDRTMASM